MADDLAGVDWQERIALLELGAPPQPWYKIAPLSPSPGEPICHSCKGRWEASQVPARPFVKLSAVVAPEPAPAALPVAIVRLRRPSAIVVVLCRLALFFLDLFPWRGRHTR